MLPFNDVHFQLVDLPPVSADFMEPWYLNALQPADAALLVLDLNDPECTEQVPAIRNHLGRKKITLQESWPGLASATGSIPADQGSRGEQVDDPFRIILPTLLVANKCELTPDPGEVEVLEELVGVRFPAVAVSARTGRGLDEIGALLFRGLEIIRVYTKAPGRPVDEDRPFAVRRGGTVADVARLVHKDIARSLRFARVWGEGTFDGQQVGPDHPVHDGDVLEMHTR
jgi:ribosome-interacting GTPase 1